MLHLMGSQSQTLHSSLILLTVKKEKSRDTVPQTLYFKGKRVSEDASVGLSHLAGLVLKPSWFFLHVCQTV